MFSTAPSAMPSAGTRVANENALNWDALIGALGPREKRLLFHAGKRLLMGQNAFGELAKGKKRWSKEALEEMLDGIVYVGAALQDLMDEEDGT